MKLVADANILFAALIKKGLTSDFLFDERLELYAPLYLLEEIDKHKQYLLDKTKLTSVESYEVIVMLKEKINWLTVDSLSYYESLADQISLDPKDVEYFSVALKLKCGIWTNDKLLKNQEIVRIYSTSDLLFFFSSHIL